MEFRGIIRRVAGAGAAVVFGAALLVGGATSAQAGPNDFKIVNGNSSDACLTVVISGDKGNLYLVRCDGRASQVWHVVNGVFSNPNSGHCLDGNGADVYTFRCNGGAYQKWTTTSGTAKSIKHTQSGKYLHADGDVGNEVVFRSPITSASRWVPLPV